METKTSEDKKVFISGSRMETFVSKDVQNSLDAIIEQKFQILIGDSEKGIDNEILDFLRLLNYENVKVFSIKRRPRVKLESNWIFNHINIEDSTLNGQQQQMMKDKKMCEEANWGLAIFKPISKNRYNSLQVSSGTLRNTIQMLLLGKSVKFFYLYENNLISQNLSGKLAINKLEEIIKQYKFENLSSEEANLILTSRGVKEDEDPAIVKYTKIQKKFNELMKSEKKNLNSDNEPPIYETMTLF